MTKNIFYKKGFTLVELLVVISIISLLSTIVLTSVDIGKARAKDSAILSGVNSIRTTMEQEFVASGSYGNLLGTNAEGVWIKERNDCGAAGFSGTFGQKLAEICEGIMTNSMYPNALGITSGSLWIGPGYSNTITPTLTPKSYVIMVYLPGVKKFHCVGQDGERSTVEDGSTVWGQPGCWSNY